MTHVYVYGDAGAEHVVFREMSVVVPEPIRVVSSEWCGDCADRPASACCKLAPPERQPRWQRFLRKTS